MNNTVWKGFTESVDDSGNIVGVQYPLSVDGDSIYAKDVDVENSNIGDFSGKITSLFDNYRSPQIALSVGEGGSNPKSFTVALKRSILATDIGIVSSNQTISNAKLILKTMDGTIVKTVDCSADSVKKGLRRCQFAQTPFSEMILEFYTDDAVSIDGVIILKSRNISIDAINGVISQSNSTNVPLNSGQIFVGDSADTKNYGTVLCGVYSDVASATDGLSIQFSTDDTNWYWSDDYTIEATEGKTFSIQTRARFLRVVYINGGTNQSVFQLETTLKPAYVKPSSRRILNSISGQDDAEIVKAILTGRDEATNVFENIKSFDGALNVTDGLVHKVPIVRYFSRDLGGSTTPSVAINIGDTDATFTSTTGFAVDDYIHIREGLTYEFAPLQIKEINGNVVSFNRPIDHAYATSAVINEIEYNMNVDGSSTSVSYKICPPAGELWQATRIIIEILDSTAMDDGLFGGRAALENGVLMRSSKSGIKHTLTLWRTNGGMANDMYDVEYTPKAPAGQYGLRGRWTFTNLGIIIELIGDNSDYEEVIVQDDLTGLDRFTIKAQGRIFGG